MQRIIIFSTLILLAALPAEAADPQFPDLPDLSDARAEMAAEPVFKGRTFVYQAGRHHAVSAVLIHGIGDEGARVWSRLIPALAQNYHVVTCDLPGFGRSTKANRLYAPESYREFVHWLIGRYARKPVIMIGHSMGAAVALAYAAAHPRDLQKLVVVDAGGILHRLALTRFMMEHHDNPRQAPEDFLNGWFNRVKIGIIEALEYPRLVDDIDMVLKSPGMRQNLLGGDPARIAGLALVQFDFSRLLSRIETPTMLVWGAEDDVAPLRTAILLEDKLPRAGLCVLPDIGHLPMLEAPELFNHRVMDALQEDIAVRPISLPLQTERVVRYVEQNDITISGGFKRIEISRCKGVRIVNAVAETLDIAGSEVEMENCAFNGKDYAVSVQASQLTMTAVEMAGDVALTASRSKLDMAGVEIVGHLKAVQALDPSDLLFSVSRIKSPITNAYMHGLYEISHRNPL